MQVSFKARKIGVLLVLMAEVIAVSGCSKKAEEHTAKSAGQVVARIGDQVVTIQELETEFRWANVSADGQKDPATVRRVLGELVTRKYLVQQALAAKLDREPSVLLDILRARDQALANAFALRQISTRTSAMGKSEIEKFIANNPAKFANRQLMSVEQISIPLNQSDQSTIDSVKDMKSLDELGQKLTAVGVPYSRSTGTLNSAEISDELLKTIEKKQDDVFFVRAGQNGVFLRVKSKQSRPIEGEAAVALARQLLRLDMLKTEASLTDISANMEAKFEGDFANIMKPQPIKLGN